MRTSRPSRVSILLPAVASLAVLAAGCNGDPPTSPVRSPHAPSAVVYAPTVSGPSLLDPFNGSNYIIPYGINDLGEIVGESHTDLYAVRWMTGTLTAPASTVALQVSGPAASARDVNDAGQIAGSGGSRAKVWTPAGAGYTETNIGLAIEATLGSYSSMSTSINDGGQVTGTYQHPTPAGPAAAITRCFLWTPATPNGTTTGSVVDLGDLAAGGGDCYAQDVNSLGAVTGGSATNADPTQLAISRHAFVWTTGTGMLDVAPTSTTFSEGEAINDGGQVAGLRLAATGNMATIWTPTGPGVWGQADLGAPSLSYQNGVGMQSWLLDIDDAGFVVGFTRDGAQLDRGFFWQNGVFTELPNALVPNTEPTALTNVLGNTLVVAGADITDQPTNSRQGLRWVVTLTPVTAQGCIASLVTLIGQMQTAGTLRAGEAKSLLAKLDAATRQIGQGHTIPAKNVLYAFINEVNALVTSGRLTAAQAQPLLDGAQCAIAAL